MAARERGRQTVSPARIALLGLLNAAALIALWQLLSPDGAPETALLAAEPPTLTAPAPQRPSALGRDEVAREVRAIIARETADASRRSQGRVDASNARVSVHVRELGGDLRAREGELAISADRAQRPASNMKLVTTAAALVLLGPAWGFATPIELAGSVEDGVLTGDLVARAGGDPLFDPRAEGSVDGLLAPLVEALEQRAIRRITGDLVLDEGAFAAPAPGPAWPPDGQRWADYCALAGGFSVNRGCLQATVTSTRAGAPARIRVEPRHHGLEQAFDVTTREGGELVVHLEAIGRAGVVVRGSIPAGTGTWSDTFAHRDPVDLFGSAVVGALTEAGIRFDGRVRRERDAAGGELLTTLRTPLAEVLGPINTDSDNPTADQLFLALGHARRGAGTRAAGSAATVEALERLGVPSAGFVQVDGSGLSRDNRVSARQIGGLIEAVLAMGEPAAGLFRGSLAVGGETGTLARRLKADGVRGRVHAKSGFIGGVSALSGVVHSLFGRTYVFSILVEYPVIGGLNSNCWKPMQDDICALLVGLEP